MTPESPKVDSPPVKWLREQEQSLEREAAECPHSQHVRRSGLCIQAEQFRLAADKLEQALVERDEAQADAQSWQDQMNRDVDTVLKLQAELERVTKERDALRNGLRDIHRGGYHGASYIAGCILKGESYRSEI